MSLKSAAECLFWTTMFCAAGVAAFADYFGPLDQWISGMDDSVVALFATGAPHDRALQPDDFVYRLVVVFCIVVTSAWTWIGRRWITNWARDIVEAYRRRKPGSHPSRSLWERAYALSVLGASAVIYLLVFDSIPNRIGAAAPRASVFLVPLLSVFAFFFICRAMTYRHLANDPKQTTDS